ncbi:MAG: hypothetical protein JOZ51_14335 [Chloroflexi bacterium]|nr:hypothetical protein [Chloroflexota bacterium]
MDDTNLVRFMQDLVNNPEELRRYKQDPSAYLASANLSEAAKGLLSQFAAPFMAVEEVSTVFTLSIPSPKQAFSTAQAEPIPLTKTAELHAPNAPVIIEKTGSAKGDQCSLLPLSYIHVSPEKVVSFSLRIAYINPKDTTDYSYVFHISLGSVPKSVEPLAENIPVSLTTIKPLVLTYNKAITRELQVGSSYDPSSGTLKLSFT